MAKTKISEYDATAANNTDIDSINIAEGMAPSNVNNAIRELMAHLKDMNIGSTITMLNTTEEDSDGGRVNKIIFKGEQSGGEESVLGEIQFSHDGTADDQKSDLIFRTNDGSDGTSPTEAARIDSQSNFLIGHSDNINVAGHEAGLQVVGQGTADYHGSTISIIGNANNGNGAYLNFAKTRSNTAGSFTAAANNDTVGMLQFSAADGTDLANTIATITAKVNDNVASNDTAGRIELATTAQGSGSPSTRVRIDVDGIKFGSDSAAANGLNDFETGTWTAGITVGSGSITLDNNYKTGLYQKIGNMVFINLHLRANAVSSPSGSVEVTGLPFPTPNNIKYRFSLGCCTHFGMTNMDASDVIMPSLSNNQNSINIFTQNGNNITSSGDRFTATSEIYITGSYMV